MSEEGGSTLSGNSTPTNLSGGVNSDSENDFTFTAGFNHL